MAVCARAIQQPDGTLLLALDPTAQDLTTCPYVVEDGTGQGWNQLANISVADANVLGLAICAVWATAYGFRLLGQAVDIHSNES